MWGILNIVLGIAVIPAFFLLARGLVLASDYLEMTGGPCMVDEWQMSTTTTAIINNPKRQGSIREYTAEPAFPQYDPRPRKPMTLRCCYCGVVSNTIEGTCPSCGAPH